MPRHFLKLSDLTRAEFSALFARTHSLKAKQKQGIVYQPLLGKTIALLFEKNSTRTRVSFEAGINQLGGSAVYLNAKESQLGRGETIPDMARVVSRMVDLVMIRTYAHRTIDDFAFHSQVPVINGLSDIDHPCQITADIFTYEELRGPIQGKIVTWLGDPNNVCQTWLQAATIFDFQIRIAAPAYYHQPHWQNANLIWCEDPFEAAEKADIIVTDTWVSMGMEDEAFKRRKDFLNYSVTPAIMKQAKAEAVFMHCLPAHRGEEVVDAVIDSEQSIVWYEAENRLHTQKALMEFLILGHIPTE